MSVEATAVKMQPWKCSLPCARPHTFWLLSSIHAYQEWLNRQLSLSHTHSHTYRHTHRHTSSQLLFLNQRLVFNPTWNKFDIKNWGLEKIKVPLWHLISKSGYIYILFSFSSWMSYVESTDCWIANTDDSLLHCGGDIGTLLGMSGVWGVKENCLSWAENNNESESCICSDCLSSMGKAEMWLLVNITTCVLTTFLLEHYQQCVCVCGLHIWCSSQPE